MSYFEIVCYPVYLTFSGLNELHNNRRLLPHYRLNFRLNPV